jgi:hypothetical protein
VQIEQQTQVKHMSNIIKLAERSPQHALQALNRMTGLEFDQWPSSLVNSSQSPHLCACIARRKGTLLSFTQKQTR